MSPIEEIRIIDQWTRLASSLPHVLYQPALTLPNVANTDPRVNTECANRPAAPSWLGHVRTKLKYRQVILELANRAATVYCKYSLIVYFNINIKITIFINSFSIGVCYSYSITTMRKKLSNKGLPVLPCLWDKKVDLYHDCTETVNQLSQMFKIWGVQCA